MIDREHIEQMRREGKRHDRDNCLACSAWAWSDDDARPAWVHLWVQA